MFASLRPWMAALSATALLAAACAPSAPTPPAPPAGQGQPAAPVDSGPFPTKPIEIIVPFAPGGGYDALARQLAVPLQKELGQPVVVKNVAGGGQRIAARQFQQSEPDGHTLLYGSDTPLYTSTFVDAPEGFDIFSWLWVAGIRGQTPMVAVPSNSPYKTLEEVLAADKAGKKLRFGHNGIGGFLPTQVAFANAVGIKNGVWVGGFTGTADIAPAFVRGDLDIEVWTPLSSTTKFVESGDFRPLAVLDAKRSPTLPNVPTARELKWPGVEKLEALGSQSGIAAPPKTPADRVAKLEKAVLNALKDPDFAKWAKDTGVAEDLIPSTGKEFGALKLKEYGLWKTLSEDLKKAVN